MIKGKINIKTIIVLLILVLVGVFASLGIKTVRTYIGGAAGANKPTGVVSVAGEDGRSVKITWKTDEPTASMVSWGSNPSQTYLKEGNTDSTTDHMVEIGNLKPNSTYYFNILVDGNPENDGGVPYSVKTKALSSEVGESVVETEEVTPELIPTAVPTTVAEGAATKKKCDKTTDYNCDGVVNSLDYFECLKGTAKAQPCSNAAKPTTAAGASTTCDPNKDNNGDGKVNSADRLKCAN